MKTIVATATIMLTILAGGALAGTAGFRGNWTGRFPDAKPPVKWTSVSDIMAGLRCQADKPAGGAPAGVTMDHGFLTEWLVAGPFKAGDEELTKAEAVLDPKAGDALGGRKWKKVSVIGSVLDFGEALGVSRDKRGGARGYGCTRIYSPEDRTVRFRWHAYPGAALYLNGAPISGKPAWSVKMNLKKGWNRLVCRSDHPAEVKISLGLYTIDWEMEIGFRAVGLPQVVTENIAWKTYLPDWGLVSPVIAGDNIYLLAEPGDVICLDKRSGRIKWIRSLTHYEVTDAETRASDPAFAEVGKLVAELEATNAELIKSGMLSVDARKARAKLYKSIVSKVKKIDQSKYYAKNQHGYCFPTPVTDGKDLYVWLGSGIAARFGPDGTRKWITSTSLENKQEHGIHSSPALVAGKFVFQRGDVTGLDAATGKIAWQIKQKEFWGRSNPIYGNSPFALSLGGREYIFMCGRLMDPATGKVLWKDTKWRSRSVTPVVGAGHLFMVGYNSEFFKAKIPATAAGFSPKPGPDLDLSITTGLRPNSWTKLQREWFAGLPRGPRLCA